MTDIGVAKIKELLPHRHPLLLVDRVIEVDPPDRLVAIKAVTCNEPWYASLDDDDGHGYPETLLVESWMQAAGLMIRLCAERTAGPGQVMLAGKLSGVDFHRRVLPGDVLRHEVRLVRDLVDTMVVAGSTLVDGEPVLTVSRALLAFRADEVLVSR